MSSAAPKLLLVANASDVALVFKALEDAGLPQPVLGVGGDETMELFEKHEPDVVLLVAGVERGDLPALASAIRSGNYGRPAPIVLIASEDDSVREPRDARDIEFDQFVSRPLVGATLADAIHRSTRDATGARIHAAMELAIESFVADAMDSLSTGALADSEGDSASPLPPSGIRPREPTAVLAPRDATAVLQPKRREATAVLDQEVDDSASTHDGEEPAAAYELDRASRDLLDQVLPNETLDVDIEELDGITDSRPQYRDGPSGDEGSGGDFARQLRQKMSAMAERLFPGQGSGENSAAAIGPAHTAHTEIDLREIVEGPVEDTAPEGSLSPGAGTHSLVNESEITMAREAATGVASEHGPAAVGEIDAQSSDIASLLGSLWRASFSGSLVIRCEEEEKRIEFDKGNIIFASSGSSEDRMGALLVREGKINAEQLADCRHQASQSGRRMGEILVDLGYLKPRELLPAVRQHLEDILYSVFAWTSGSYRAVPEPVIEERIRLSRHPAALLVEGIRRKYEASRLESCFGDKNTIVRVLAGETLSAVVGATELSAAENKGIGLFDGDHSVEQIAQACGLERLRVAQLAHAWVCLGVAELVESSADEGVDRPGGKPYLVGETDLEIDRKRVLAKYLLVQEADYFQLLGVRADASAFEIRRAYEAAQRYFSIESFPLELQEELKGPLEEIAEVLGEAYTVLSDDRVRNSYRANLH